MIGELKHTKKEKKRAKEELHLGKAQFPTKTEICFMHLQIKQI